MPTVKLVASNYSVTGTVTVQNPDNMYTDVSSTTYATLTHTTSGTTSYYCYIKGFNFSAVPDNANVSSITIRIRGYETGLSTSATYAPRLYNDTSTITGASAASANFGASASTITVPYTGTWDTLKGYGADLGIRVTIRRSARNTQGYLYIYGAEIEVTYTVPVYHSVTIQNSTSANVQASDTNPLEGDDVVISTDTLSGLTIKDNGTDVTNQFVQETGGTVAATADGFTTGYSTTGISFYTSSSSAGNNFNYAVGHTAESPGSTASGSGSWTYVKTSSGSTTGTGYADFTFDFSSIPANATITSVQVKCYGAVEDSSQTTSHSDITLYSGSTQKGTTQKFTSSSNSIITLSNVGTWTRAELQQAKLRFAVGYYGGHLFGITWTVTYQASGYVYTITAIAADHTIVVTGGGSGNPPVITVGTPSRTRISAITNFDQCVCTFTSDLALSQWEARATKAGVTPARGVGLLVESGGALAANVPATIYVENEELTQGDGEYTITVYGLSTGGVWSE